MTCGRILIVEDNPLIATCLVDAFTESGFEAESVSSIMQATARLLSLPTINLITLDLSCDSDDNATNFVKGCDAPVLVLTGDDAIDVRLALLDAGAADFVGKPFAYKELALRIRNILRRTILPSRFI